MFLAHPPVDPPAGGVYGTGDGGMASAVAKWTTAGKSVSYVMVTRGEAGLAIPPAEAGPLREDEERLRRVDGEVVVVGPAEAQRHRLTGVKVFLVSGDPVGGNVELGRGRVPALKVVPGKKSQICSHRLCRYTGKWRKLAGSLSACVGNMADTANQGG